MKFVEERREREKGTPPVVFWMLDRQIPGGARRSH